MSKTRPWLWTGVISPLYVVLALRGFISFDLALLFIQLTLVMALMPGIIENFKNKTGWSKETALLTSSGLISMSIIFFMVNLMLAGIATLFSGALWAVLCGQSMIYEKV